MAEPAPSSQLQELMRRAVALHQAGRLGDAEALYRRALVDDPANPDALNLLGVLVAQRGRPADGARLIRQAIASRPFDQLRRDVLASLFSHHLPTA